MGSPSGAAKQLVRDFSIDIESKMSTEASPEPLAMAIVDTRKEEDARKQELAQWRKYFEAWPVSKDPRRAVLDTEGNELSKTWQSFRDILPPEDRVKFDKRPPKLDDVFAVIQEADNKWRAKKDQGNFGKSKTIFRKICGALDSHSQMLEILPASSQYVSIFYGTLQSLIKACANYEKIAEGLSRAICEINDIIAPCVLWKSLYPVDDMEAFVERLYANIFIFLRDAMLWYQKKSRARALLSFKENFYDDFEAKIADIKTIASSVTQRALMGMGAEVRVSRLQLERDATDLRIGLQGVEREMAELRHQADQLARQRAEDEEERRLLKLEAPARFDSFIKLIGGMTTNLLQFQAQGQLDAWATEQRTLPHALLGIPQEKSITDQEIVETCKDMTRPDEATQTQRREDIQLFSSHLEDHFDRRQVLPPFEEAAQLFVEPSVISGLREWTVAAHSQLLCVAGPDQPGNTPLTSKVASKYASFAAKSGIPVISFFCELPAQKPLSGQTREEVALISLVYALVRQLVEILPMDFVSKVDFGADRFNLLDGTLGSWTESMELLEDLLSLRPSHLFCVIDGFQWLDDSSTKKYLDNLLDIFSHHTGATQNFGLSLSKMVLKILFTTAGKSRCLLGKLSRDELLLADQSRVAMSSGSDGPGRLPLQYALE